MIIIQNKIFIVLFFLILFLFPISNDINVTIKGSEIQTIRNCFISLNDKDTYDFIENLASSQKILLDFVGVKPYRVDLIYKKLLKIKNNKNNDRQINEFITEFEKRYVDKFTDKTIDSYRFINVTDKKTYGWGDPYLEQGYILQKEVNNKDKELSANVSQVGFKAFVNYDNYLSLYSNTSIKIIHDDFGFRDEFANPLIFDYGNNEVNSEDYTETYLMLYNDNLDLTIGKFPITEGVGYLNSLTLSQQKQYFESIHFNWQTKYLKFSTISGFLIADNETRNEYTDSLFSNGSFVEMDRKARRTKYLSSHRIEWKMMDNLNFGVNENLIYGDRPLEIGYLVPVLPLFWMEHYYGDLDNATMSFDLHYRPIKNYSLYTELFVDDETFTKSFTEFYGNKWAFLIGVYNSNFLTVEHLNFRFEYSRIEPFVYTHKYHINRYKNVDNFLGGEFGPDSELMNFKIDYSFGFGKNISLNFKRANVGEPIPGKLDEPDYANDIKTFLRGRVEKHSYYSADFNWQYNDYLGFNLFYSHTDIVNLEHDVDKGYNNNTVALFVKIKFKNYLLKWF